jgi:hypothetical protein
MSLEHPTQSTIEELKEAIRFVNAASCSASAGDPIVFSDVVSRHNACLFASDSDILAKGFATWLDEAFVEGANEDETSFDITRLDSLGRIALRERLDCKAVSTELAILLWRLPTASAALSTTYDAGSRLLASRVLAASAANPTVSVRFVSVRMHFPFDTIPRSSSAQRLRTEGSMLCYSWPIPDTPATFSDTA